MMVDRTDTGLINSSNEGKDEVRFYPDIRLRKIIAEFPKSTAKNSATWTMGVHHRGMQVPWVFESVLADIVEYDQRP